jgi:hypothetical protein
MGSRPTNKKQNFRAPSFRLTGVPSDRSTSLRWSYRGPQRQVFVVGVVGRKGGKPKAQISNTRFIHPGSEVPVADCYPTDCTRCPPFL